MKFVPLIAFVLLLFACNKREENAMKLAGVWDLEATVVTNYSNNEPTGDSLVNQTGRLIFEVAGNLDNPCYNNLDYPPCLQTCYWDFPKKKEDQLFFYYYDESTFTIYSSSCAIQHLSKRRLEILSVSYDNELNIQQKTVWKFKRSKL